MTVATKRKQSELLGCQQRPVSTQPASLSDLTAPRSAGATRSYARITDVCRAVAAARKAGVVVESVELRPDGTIRVGQASGSATASAEFDMWDAAGKL